MTELLLRMLVSVTFGLVLVLLLRRPARRVFGAGPAFTLWLLPIVLVVAPLLPQELAPAAMVVLPGMTVTPHAMTAASPTASSDWPDWLAALWVLGAVAGLLRLALHYVRLLRGLRAASGRWERMLTSAVPDLDIRRVRIHAAGPAVLWALPRSLILLPDDFAGRFATTATRELVLRHELAHACRCDALWSLVMEIASALLWFHPLVWIGRARFRLDQELACDAASLRALPQQTANYARALLHSVAVQPAPALIAWLAEPQLKERIAMISRIPPGATRRRIGFVAVAAILAAGLYVAGGQTPVFALQSSPVTPSVDVAWKNAHPPHYPVGALRNGEQGLVLLDVTVDADGQVSGVTVDSRGTTAPAKLQEAAIDAAKRWRYAPGHEDGKAVGGVVKIPVKFSLMGEGPATGASASSPSVDITYKNRNPPRYPVEAIKKGQQGTVVLDVTVDATGKVTGVQVDQKGTDAPVELQTVAIAAARHWKFNPGRNNGKALGGMIQVPVNFSLNRTQANHHDASPCPAGDLFDVKTLKCIPDASRSVPQSPAHRE